MKIHCLMTVFVIIAGAVFRISKTEWCICLLLCGLIMALELVNTSVEAVVDLVTEEHRTLAKIAKDTAAGAVLIAAVAAAVIGCIIFLPKVAVFAARLFRGTDTFIFQSTMLPHRLIPSPCGLKMHSVLVNWKCGFRCVVVYKIHETVYNKGSVLYRLAENE